MILLIASVLCIIPWNVVQGRPEGQYPLGEHGDVRNPADGTYSFHYQVPGHSTRSVEFNGSGKVEGSYTFVSPDGKEFEFKYEADEDGIVIESDALPVGPKDTTEVKLAKDEFFKAFGKEVRQEVDALPVIPEDTEEVRLAKKVFFRAYCRELRRKEDYGIRYYNTNRSYEDVSVESSEEDRSFSKRSIEIDGHPEKPIYTVEVNSDNEEFFKAYCKELEEKDYGIRQYDTRNIYEEDSIESSEEANYTG